MSDNKHTTGPWRAHFEEAYFVTSPDLGRVAMMMNLKGAHGLGGRRSGDESAANCRLISAAPDMLEALQRIRRWFEAEKCKYTGDHPIAQVRAAIEKATGQEGGKDHG